MIWRILIASVILQSAGWMTLFAQTGLRVSAAPAGTLIGVAENSTVPVVSDGRELLVPIRLNNVGAVSITVNQISVSGGDFTLVAPALPAVVPSNGNIVFNVRYTPVFGRVSTATVTIQYTEAAQSRTFAFGLSGAAPDLSFLLTTAEGQTGSISPNGVIAFPPTRLQNTQTQVLVIRNTGGAVATLRSIGFSSAEFSASTPTPISIGPSQDVAIPIAFTPQVRGASSGRVALAFDGFNVSFSITGSGAAPEYVVAYALRANGNTLPLGNNTRVEFPPTAATSTSIVDVLITNEGNASGTVRSVAISGNAFQLTGVPLLPVTIPPGQTVRFALQYSPTQLGTSTGTIRIELDDRTIAATLAGSTLQPEFSPAYIDPSSNNVQTLAVGGTIPFAGTNVGNTTSVVVVLRNQGPGTGFVTGVSVSGTAFQLTDVPALPVTVEPSRDVRFGVRFAPQERQRQSGLLKIDLSNGSIQVNLDGSGVAADLLYQRTSGVGDATEVRPGSEITIASNVGETATSRLHFRNQGNADAQIPAITISGQGFQIANTPFTPLTLKPGEAQTLDVTFSPTQPGSARGRLRIGNDSFDLVGNGLGPRLAFSVINSAGATPVAENGTIVFPPTRVGESSRVDISIDNTGTTPAVVSTIDVTSSNGIFTLDRVPALPIALDPGATLRFSVLFSPNNIGNLAASVRVNNSVFGLSATGQQPVSLPDYQIEGPRGVQQPLQQIGYGLRMSSRYPLPVRGTLTLNFISDVFAPNPAVQFATGGRTANFTIPANTDQAIFENGLTEIKLQTGTVAGSISVVPTFSTQAGLDLTPATRPSASVTLSPTAPRLLSVETFGRTANSIQLVLSGYSTTRALRQFDIQITPRNGEKFVTTNLVVNVDSASLVWFQSEASQSFGGLFSVIVPLNLQRGNSTDDLIQYIQTISVTATNEVGRSNSVSSVF